MLIKMFEDGKVSVEEIIEVFPFLINGMIQSLEHFDDAVEELKYEYSKICNLEDFNNYGTNIEYLEQNLEEVINQIRKNNEYLDKMKREIEQLKKLENNLVEQISNDEDKLNIINARISNIHRKKDNLQGARDTILLCKLLTNTSFVYKMPSVSGYVVGQSSKTIKCFEFNPEEISKSEITNSLYDILKKVNSEVGQTHINFFCEQSTNAI